MRQIAVHVAWLRACSLHALSPPPHPADALTSIRSVNNTDVITLGTRFGSLAAIMAATPEQLATCPGIGPTKVQRIQETFRAPVRRAAQPLRLPRSDEQLGGGSAEPPVEPPPGAGETEDVEVAEEGGDSEQGLPPGPRDDVSFQLAPDDSEEDELPSVLD